MALVNSRGLLRDARANGYAVGAFNVENMEMMQAVIAGGGGRARAGHTSDDAIHIKIRGASSLRGHGRALAGKASVPVAMHLDHGDRFGLCQQAASDGYTSLMIDGSKLPLDENIALARRVVEMASGMSSRPCVEAELGKLGGKEDDLEVKPGEDLYTDPGEAARFVRETGIDSLAVAIGTAHGFYKGKPRLAFERLTQIREAVDIPLVLHGSSGVPDEDVQRAVSMGVCKVNFATELRAAYTQAVRDCLAHDAALYDPKKYGGPAREAVISLVRHRIKICAGKVGLIAPL